MHCCFFLPHISTANILGKLRFSLIQETILESLFHSTRNRSFFELNHRFSELHLRFLVSSFYCFILPLRTYNGNALFLMFFCFPAVFCFAYPYSYSPKEKEVLPTNYQQLALRCLLAPSYHHWSSYTREVLQMFYSFTDSRFKS